MRWIEGFIAADWGTTNRRAYLIGPDGDCVDEFEDDKGILSVGRDAFGDAVAELRDRLGDRPLLLAGMVGSNRGWVEAPYVGCPASLGDLTDALVWPEQGRTAIVPGVCFQDSDEADVMRGEEVQLLGAFAAGLVPGDALVCHPGTHNKWVRLESGRIGRFTTVMTGELFSLLKEHSILSDLLSGSVTAGDAFGKGVRRGLEDDRLMAELFKVRARVLLGEADAGDAASYCSGLLIGTDVRTGLREGTDSEIYVMGRPELTALYAEALRIAGREPREVDGERAFLAGARKIVELIDERS
ncbi:MAG TPA: 2-dehydro-3-deoxygalactonokinase [Sphingomicrobium sp.]|nr:2-dehydro-3-deoxygalactonokinase [Sphingomicrobium sp.]